MTVYVAQGTDNDKIADARRFGDLEFVNFSYVYADQVEDELLPPTYVYHMRKAAERFNPDEDYLLIFGDHLQLIAFTAELARRYTHFRVLRWDRVNNLYFPVLMRPQS